MKTSRTQRLSMLVALAVAASGLAVAAPSAAPMTKATPYTSYRQCLAAESNACLFPGPSLPTTPEEEVIYAQCLDDAVAYCLSLFPPA